MTITNLDKVEEPASLIALREHVGNLLPKVDLTELVLEINALTGFADEFTHASEAMPAPLICLSAFARYYWPKPATSEWNRWFKTMCPR